MKPIEKPAVLITGAGSGIGAATAQLFSAQGHTVILVGRRKAALEAVAQKLKNPSHVVVGDVTDSENVNHLVAETLRVAPELGVLINNAGIYERGPFEKCDDELWHRIFETNIFGVVRLTRLLVPHLAATRAAVIVNVASTAGLRPVPGLSAYATSKAALISLTQTLALELAPKNIRVNCVCPGVVDTPIHQLEGLPASEQAKSRESWNEMHPLGRFGTAEDAAWAIYQLTTPQTQWLTGVVLPVDGGLSLT